MSRSRVAVAMLAAVALTTLAVDADARRDRPTARTRGVTVATAHRALLPAPAARRLLPAPAATRRLLPAPVAPQRLLPAPARGTRNSLLSAFRGRLPSKHQGVWDELDRHQRSDVLYKAAVKGQMPWTDYLDALDELGFAGPFEASALSARPQNYTVLGKDAGHPRSKFVVVRDLPARMVIDLGQVPVDREGEPLYTARQLKDPRTIDHSVSVATPNGKQPVWLHQVDPKSAQHLGRMVRDALTVLPRTHGVSWATQAYVNMPGVISLPRLHAHGTWRPDAKARVSDWDGFLRSNRYQKIDQSASYALYAAPSKASGAASQLPIVAVASPALGATAKVNAATDGVLGQMILDVSRAALRSGRPQALQRGRIEIDSTDSRLVVRLFERSPRDAGE